MAEFRIAEKMVGRVKFYQAEVKLKFLWLSWWQPFWVGSETVWYAWAAWSKNRAYAEREIQKFKELKDL